MPFPFWRGILCFSSCHRCHGADVVFNQRQAALELLLERWDRKCPRPQHDCMFKIITHPKCTSLSWPLKCCLFCFSASAELWVLAAHFSIPSVSCNPVLIKSFITDLSQNKCAVNTESTRIKPTSDTKYCDTDQFYVHTVTSNTAAWLQSQQLPISLYKVRSFQHGSSWIRRRTDRSSQTAPESLARPVLRI